nr:hypothetical protein [Physocyclus mexicanus]
MIYFVRYILIVVLFTTFELADLQLTPESYPCTGEVVFQSCGSACYIEKTCRNYDQMTRRPKILGPLICTLQCVERCVCKGGLVRSDDGKCVKPEECPKYRRRFPLGP